MSDHLPIAPAAPVDPAAKLYATTRAERKAVQPTYTIKTLPREILKYLVDSHFGSLPAVRIMRAANTSLLSSGYSDMSLFDLYSIWLQLYSVDAIKDRRPAGTLIEYEFTVKQFAIFFKTWMNDGKRGACHLAATNDMVIPDNKLLGVRRFSDKLFAAMGARKREMETEAKAAMSQTALSQTALSQTATRGDPLRPINVTPVSTTIIQHVSGLLSYAAVTRVNNIPSIVIPLETEVLNAIRMLSDRGARLYGLMSAVRLLYGGSGELNKGAVETLLPKRPKPAKPVKPTTRLNAVKGDVALNAVKGDVALNAVKGDVALNAITPNAITPNAITPNAITPNAIISTPEVITTSVATPTLDAYDGGDVDIGAVLKKARELEDSHSRALMLAREAVIIADAELKREAHAQRAGNAFGGHDGDAINSDVIIGIDPDVDFNSSSGSHDRLAKDVKYGENKTGEVRYDTIELEDSEDAEDREDREDAEDREDPLDEPNSPLENYKPTKTAKAIRKEEDAARRNETIVAEQRRPLLDRLAESDILD